MENLDSQTSKHPENLKSGHMDIQTGIYFIVSALIKYPMNYNLLETLCTAVTGWPNSSPYQTFATFVESPWIGPLHQN